MGVIYVSSNFEYNFYKPSAVLKGIKIDLGILLHIVFPSSRTGL